MLRRTFALPTIAFALSLLGSTNAEAAGQRTFVASDGNDLNPCTLLLPCRTFAPAIAATSAAGEVIVLDSAGYGSFTITQSISIIAPPGVYAGFSPTAGQDGVIITAGVNDRVVLRGLTINGQGGTKGIVVNSGGQVHIEQCTVSNMVGDGIWINGGGQIHIRSSIVRRSGAAGLWSGGGTQKVEVLDSQFTANLDGIQVERGTLDARRIAADNNLGTGVRLLFLPASTTAVVTLTDSIMSGNGAHGVWVQADNSGSVARLAMVRSTSARNTLDGITALGAATVKVSVSDSALVENARDGMRVSGGAGVSAVLTRSTLAHNGEDEARQFGSAVLRSAENNMKVNSTSGIITPLPQF